MWFHNLRLKRGANQFVGCAKYFSGLLWKGFIDKRIYGINKKAKTLLVYVSSGTYVKCYVG